MTVGTAQLLTIPFPLNDEIALNESVVSVTVSVACLVPAADGVKVPLIVQLVPAARVAGNVPQVLLEREKSLAFVPDRAVELIVAFAVPGSEIVNVTGDDDVFTI